MRTFIAIPLPAEIRGKLEPVLKDLSSMSSVVRWSNSGNLHLTLRFVGEISSEVLDDLRIEMRRALSGTERFRLQLDGYGAFPNLRHPKVFWAA